MTFKTYRALTNRLDCCPNCIRTTLLKSTSFTGPFSSGPCFNNPNMAVCLYVVIYMARLLGAIPSLRDCCFPF